jgi:hypothetical protein
MRPSLARPKGIERVMGGADVGPSGNKFRIHVTSVSISIRRGLANNSGDTTSPPKYAHTFRRTRLRLDGVMVSGANIALTPLDAGSKAQVDIEIDATHRLIGTMTVDRVRVSAERDGRFVPMSISGLFNGFVDEQLGPVYSDLVMSDTPYAYWRLGESSGTTATDISGNGRDGTYTGTFTLGQASGIPGETDTAVLLDGATGHIDCGDTQMRVGGTSVTLEAWVKLTAINPAARMMVVSKHINVQPGFRLFVDTDNTVGFGTRDGTNINTADTLAANTLYHLVAVEPGSAGGDAKIYIDGIEKASGALPNVSGNTTINFIIGKELTSIGFLDGTVDEVAVYDYPLNATQALRHARAGR